MLSFTVLSPEEVRRKYEQAPNKAQMIGILAELTLCKKSEMVEFLGLEKTPVSKYDPRSAAGRPLAVFDEELAMELLEKNHMDKQIAEKVGVDWHCIWSWRKREGLQSGAARRFAKQSEQRMALYKAGWSDHEIAVAEGSNTKRIQSWRLRLKLPANGKKKGSSNGN